jgi:hypothetical protein
MWSKGELQIKTQLSLPENDHNYDKNVKNILFINVWRKSVFDIWRWFDNCFICFVQVLVYILLYHVLFLFQDFCTWAHFIHDKNWCCFYSRIFVHEFIIHDKNLRCFYCLYKNPGIKTTPVLIVYKMSSCTKILE